MSYCFDQVDRTDDSYGISVQTLDDLLESQRWANEEDEDEAEDENE